MNVGQAVGILIQAVKVAQKSGTYTLDEASVIQQAVKTLTVTKPEDIVPDKKAATDSSDADKE